MQKAAPSLGRILTMVVFALSCFGLLLFLWLSFGGAIPLQPEGYRFQVAFPEAATLAEEADVRIAGVDVGKIKSKQLDKGGARTLTEVELDEKYAPIPQNTRAILRQKTLLGETYVELTPGDPASGMLPEGGTLDNANVEDTVELDELLRIFDPQTQKAFRNWVEEQGESIKGGTSQDLNDALGNLPEFSDSGSDVLQVLDEQEQAVRELIRNTGVVFAALNEREGALRELIVNSNNTFEATASEQEALAETFQVFPTFLRESRLTMERLERFSRDTHPLVNDLKPVADDLGPTMRDLGDLAPRLESLFRDFRPLIRSSRTTLPEAERFIRGAEPVFEALHVFLPELNPILSYLNLEQYMLADFMTVGGAAVGSRAPVQGGAPAPIHLLPQVAILGGSSQRFGETERPEEERGQAYIANNALTRAQGFGIQESFDCAPAGGQKRDPEDEPPPGNNPPPPFGDGEPAKPPCFVRGPSLWDGNHYPNVRGLQAPLPGTGRVPTPSPPPKLSGAGVR